MAVSCAIEMDIADVAADRLLTEMEQGSPETRESSIQRIIGSIDPQKEFECIAAFLDPKPALYSIQYRQFANQLHLRTVPMLRYCTAGDSMNPAIFWPMHYFKTNVGTVALSRLAAHMLVMASEESSGNIRGLEIVIPGENGFQRIPEDECERMEQDALRNATRIGEFVMGTV
jgi:hypothetical protein